jgi:hypothetical protein
LDDFRVTGLHQAAFEWKDSYGNGTLDQEFGVDLASFRGTWKVKDMPGQGGSWSGDRP